FIAGLGPAGYYYYNTFSDCGGGFCSGGTWTHHVGLTRTSLRGDTLAVDFEVEPNDSPGTAQVASLPFVVQADIDRNDLGTFNSAIFWNQDNSDQEAQDWYTFTLDSQTAVAIHLDFSGSPTLTDLDVYLFNSTANTNIDYSVADNAGTGVYTETLSTTLDAGTYVLGVQAFITTERVTYSLSIQ
ncbi:MAG: PPC domain-containing protein, partial [Desulfobacterales bacterium]